MLILTGASGSEQLSSLGPIDLRGAQISQLFADSPVNLLVSFFGGLLLTGLLWGAVSNYWLFIWLAGTLGVACGTIRSLLEIPEPFSFGSSRAALG